MYEHLPWIWEGVKVIDSSSHIIGSFRNKCVREVNYLSREIVADFSTENGQRGIITADSAGQPIILKKKP